MFAPTFFTSRGVVAFNFTGFVDPNSGPLSYTWGVGSAPGLVDVLPAVRYNGARRLGQSARTADASHYCMMAVRGGCLDPFWLRFP